MTIGVRNALLAMAIGILAVAGDLMVAIAAGPSAVSPTIGVAIMHGKGGLPTRHVAELETFLVEKNFLVANLEMPWSGRRDYDVDVAAAEAELKTALEALRGKGAEKLFVAGHSQGGMFALYFAGRNLVDGAIAIAPGGYADGPLTRQKLAESVDAARQLIVAGKASEKARLLDFEGAKGTYPIIVKPDIYLTWFDPEGAMTTETSSDSAVMAGRLAVGADPGGVLAGAAQQGLEQGQFPQDVERRGGHRPHVAPAAAADPNRRQHVQAHQGQATQGVNPTGREGRQQRR